MTFGTQAHQITPKVRQPRGALHSYIIELSELIEMINASLFSDSPFSYGAACGPSRAWSALKLQLLDTVRSAGRAAAFADLAACLVTPATPLRPVLRRAARMLRAPCAGERGSDLFDPVVASVQFDPVVACVEVGLELPEQCVAAARRWTLPRAPEHSWTSESWRLIEVAPMPPMRLKPLTVAIQLGLRGARQFVLDSLDRWSRRHGPDGTTSCKGSLFATSIPKAAAQAVALFRVALGFFGTQKVDARNNP